MSVEVEAVEVDLKTQVAELAKKLDSFTSDHHEFRKVHISRKGPEGGKGETGPTGPQGPPADVSAVVQAAKDAMKQEVTSLLAEVRSLQNKFLAREILSATELSQAVLVELLKSGVIGDDGKAILIPGPAGRDGSVGPEGDVGPAGKDGPSGRDGVDGKSITGPAGRDGKDGERGERGEPGVSNVPGPQGERGEEGSQGIPGVGMDKDAIVKLLDDMKRRGYFRN